MQWKIEGWCLLMLYRSLNYITVQVLVHLPYNTPQFKHFDKIMLYGFWWNRENSQSAASTGDYTFTKLHLLNSYCVATNAKFYRSINWWICKMTLQDSSPSMYLSWIIFANLCSPAFAETVKSDSAASVDDHMFTKLHLLNWYIVHLLMQSCHL